MEKSKIGRDASGSTAEGIVVTMNSEWENSSVQFTSAGTLKLSVLSLIMKKPQIIITPSFNEFLLLSWLDSLFERCRGSGVVVLIGVVSRQVASGVTV